MRTRVYSLLSIICGASLFGSCVTGGSTGKPIVLGDTSTIVTETDSAYLKDFVEDIKPSSASSAPPADSSTTPMASTLAPDTAAKQPTQPEQPVAKTEKEETEKEEVSVGEEGLAIVFKNVSVVIPGIKARSGSSQKAISNAASVTYQLTRGTLNNKQIKVSGGTVESISQKVQSVIEVRNNLGTLELSNLTATSGWEKLRGGKNAYTISALTASQLPEPRISPSSLRSAVSRAAKAQRMKKAKEQQWLAAIKNVRRADQKPLRLSMKSVTWKIDGKDASGKRYSKQVRMDI
ncbi:MAG: hypothetical protein EOP56_00975 [Sphingobacteriales bacterium]|nr:MAG: hypothetical protein EOP56_00975 [Sphingobacteriales bacterium]